MGLNQALLQQLLEYNPATGELFWRKRNEALFDSLRACKSWNGKYAGKLAFTSTHSTGYLSGSVFGKSYLAHRVIWILYYGSDPDIIDHDNGVKSDNKLANLKDVSPTNSMRNTPKPKHNTSGIVGVHWASHISKWAATIKVNKKSNHLGYFENFDNAVSARKNAEQLHNFNPNHGR